MIFNRSQIARLEENYKNVIDPRNGFDNGV